MRLVLGVDAGGTSTRAAAFTVDGEEVGRGTADGGNPGTLGLDHACANVSSAIASALAGADSALVESVALGLAGNPALAGALTRRLFAASPETGLPHALRPRLVRNVGDVVTAFCAGTPSPSGTVLISGTGAIAAKITGRAVVATSDGYGWLLGDDGSGFWLGRTAARAALRALTEGRPSPLADLVTRRLLPAAPPHDPAPGPALGLALRPALADRLVAAVHSRPPLALAELAPLVSEAAAAGDPEAVAIATEAAHLLAATALRVHDPRSPLVLAGSVLTSPGPVRDSVRDLLGTVHTAGDPAGAAAWLATLPLLDPADAEKRHARFVPHSQPSPPSSTESRPSGPRRSNARRTFPAPRSA
ncbi:N-acetylglucosamine kinase [Nonomuraea ceibae]|uniref:N-acetylglucosamine kinase n=1 Tax=Nonomuraea ceibae TaxID=1935170 RepID=UPI001C5F3556|nr:BadF/BadG/BcrA/BcrD ATPase family protein [Nonomuraea ceibae]